MLTDRQVLTPFGHIADAVKSTVPQEMWGEIIAKLDEAEQHSEVLKVGYGLL